MNVVVTVLAAVVVTADLALGVPVGYGPPQPMPPPHKFRPPYGPPVPSKFPPHVAGGPFTDKDEFFSKYNAFSLPPGVRGPPPFGKYPQPPPNKQHQQQQHSANYRPLGPQFQSKPHLLSNTIPHQGQSVGGSVSGLEQRVQVQPRPTTKITNVWTGPKLSGRPDFPPRFPAGPLAPVSETPVTLPEKPRGSYIINSDDERGPIKTIPAPNLNPADKPADFEEQMYRAQHHQSYIQPLDNSITDERQPYQVTEDPSTYKPFSNQPSYFAPDPDTVPVQKVPPTKDINSIPTVGKVPLDVALQQHLDHQHQQHSSAEHDGSADKLSPQELYALLNGNPGAAPAVPPTTYMVPQTVMYAVPQPQSLDLPVSHQLIHMQYGQQPAATAVQLQYAQPAVADLQYLQSQTVQYQPQIVQYQPQSVQYQPQGVQYQPESVQFQQYHQQQPFEQQYSAQPTTAEDSTYNQQQQEQEQQQNQQQEQEQKQQQEQIQQQHEQIQQQQEQIKRQQLQENDVKYQLTQENYEPRNREQSATEHRAPGEEVEKDQGKFESIRSQYYTAVPNEQTAGVLAQIAESAAANDATAVADESSRVETAAEAVKPADQAVSSSGGDQPSAEVQSKTSVQVQRSVPLYEGSYASSRSTNQEYAEEDESMEGSESAIVSSEMSVNGHAPSQFPYNAAKINGFAGN